MSWYKESVFYHIYPLGLTDAPKENTYSEPVHRLREVEKWIPHIKAIGCNALYIGPLFESVGHGYETTDYKKLDSRLGDNEDLKRFVSECHKAGIRVIFDGVFNHTGRDFFAFKDIIINRENSRYRDWYCNVNFYGNNEYNDGFSYDNWGGYNLLVKLNQRNPEVKDYICDVIRFWVSEFDVDGIRLDAADVLDFDFMRALRYVADTVKPDFWLMGEVIHGDYTRWVNTNTLHSVTNYTLHKGLYSGHNDHNYFEIAHTVKRLSDMFGNNFNNVSLYNFTDNHDVERIYTKLINKANYYPVHILEYTLPGVPSIYYGSEFGIEGKKERYSDASLRPHLSYDDYKDAINNNSYTKFISELGKARSLSKTLSYGDYKEVSLLNRQYVFTRNTDRFTAIIAVNNDENEAVVRGSNIRDGRYKGILLGNDLTVCNGYFEGKIPANFGEIWIMEDEIQEAGTPFIPIETTTPIIPIEATTPFVNQEVTSVDTPINASKTLDVISTTSNHEPEDSTPYTNEHEPEDSAPSTSEHEPEDSSLATNSHVAIHESAAEPLVSAPENGIVEVIVKPQVPCAPDNASERFGLDEKYASIDTEEVKNRSDYDNMTMEELQVGILMKMAANGPVNDQMIKSVMDNVYMNSLQNWIRSFR